MSHILSIDHLTKSFGEKVVLNDISLTIKYNEFVTLLGPSGCGKTTLLRLIGGFETFEEGTIDFMGDDILNIPPNQRKINTVFQHYALFPHLNVYDNIAFGLKMKKCSKEEIDETVKDMLKLVKLTGYERRRIDTLSGGQKQRVAIARALVNRPKLLLLDEPLGALDLKLRQDMQYELKEMQRQLGITFIFVTHDQEEALTMSDRVVVMNDGVIQQIGTPEDIYNEPVNQFSASFIGESNIISGVMVKDYEVTFEGLTHHCVDRGFNPNEPVDVVIRPEDITLNPPKEDTICGVVTDVTFKGVHYEICVMVNEKEYVIHSTKAQSKEDKVSLSFGPNDIHIMRKSHASG
ncbi:MAG: spermidine/putrescine ABC transporter ATP-binding protein [Candidatus Izemoplasma sp.]|nr:spermidine/putrescine ABC transporter ATP-binding protein [Candidatus Izemoplasma sp.]